MTTGQRAILAFAMLFAVAAIAKNALQKIEDHDGADPGVVMIKGDDFQVATGGSNGDCLVWDDTADAGVAWDPTCGGGGGDNVLVDSAATVDPDFQDGDVDFTYAAGVVTATVGCSQCVSYSEIQNVSTTNRLLGRDTAGAGVIEEITVSAALDMISASSGSMLFRDVASWNVGAVQVDTSTYAVYPPLDNARNLGRTDARWDEIYVTHIDNNGGALTVDGSPTPTADDTYSLGGAFTRWSAVHAYTGAFDEITDNGSGAVGVSADLTPTSSGAYDLGSTSFLYGTIAGITTYTRLLDAPGAEDMDYGSADVTDHTFTTDGTGDSEIVLPDDSIGAAELNVNAACNFWPVDSIFISMSSTNPGTSLGCGTWSAFGAGRVLVSLDSGDTSWDTAGETGGSKTHNHTGTTASANTGATQRGTTASTLTLQAHTHTFTTNSDNGIAMPYIAVYMWRRTA